MAMVEPDSPFVPLADRERIREIVAEACRPIGPYWPMKTFAYYNPLRDLEYLPFSQAIQQARHLLGGNGLLPPDEYRRLLQQGRITETAVGSALERVGPPLPSPDCIHVGGRTIHVRDVWRIHVLYGIAELPSGLFSWTIESESASKRFRSDLPEASRRMIVDRTIRECEHCRHDPEGIYLNNIWKTLVSAFQLSDPHLGGSTTHGPDRWWDSRSVQDGDIIDPIDLPANRTLGDWVDRLAGETVVESVNSQLIKWIAAFVDEGLAGWNMPLRERGFYRVWRTLAQEDRSVELLGIVQARRKIRELPEEPEAALLLHLQAMAIQRDRWGDYLSRHLAQLPGWAGFIRWRGDNPAYPAQRRYPVDALQYLAVRLFYESEMVNRICVDRWEIAGSRPALAEYWTARSASYRSLMDSCLPVMEEATRTLCRHVWRLFHLVQFLELTAVDLHEASQSDMEVLLAWLDCFPEEAHGLVWLEAYEDEYRRYLLKKLNAHQKSRQQAGSKCEERPRAQGIFCIDARSESFRRHLEAQGPYDTFGYAGFFGIPMSHVAFDRHDHLALCPILLSPNAEVVEVPRAGEESRMRDYLSGTRWHHLSQHLFHDLKHNPVASFILVDVLGVFFSIGLAGKTLFRVSFHSLKNRLHRWLAKPVVTTIPLDRSQDPAEAASHPSGLVIGFTHEEQAAFVEGGLRGIGLTKNFGRFVMVCGHGSQTDNNPYYSALDCGACGGSHGDPNARVFAAMANHPEVRRLLKDRGLIIPEDTWFLPAKHNTTTDRVTFYDLVDLPAGHVEDLNLFSRDLVEAGARQALERCHRLPGAPTNVSPQEAFGHVGTRGMDWANARPEWGLSGNAAFLIGRRALTKGLDLGGRVFLHSYDPESDCDGGLLEKIMTAPLIVGELISLTYYFSAVDPWFYGSGSKVIHNIVSGIGVMLGSHSDIQKGLPLQSVNDGARHYHEPMRLLAVLEAPPARIQTIIERHLVLRHLFQNQWMNLVALDPDSHSFFRYLPDSAWEPLALEG